MSIDAERARAAVGALADHLGLDLNTTAQGIVSIVTANMARAIRVISVQRGHDPRDYTLVAFGGAGPLHAARLARELDIPRILVPRNPGILCALGLLMTDLKTNYAQTKQMRLDAECHAEVAHVFDALDRRADAWFTEEGVASDCRQVRRTIDMRYVGQNYELPISMPDGLEGERLLAELKRRFEDAHRQMYGYVAEEEPIQAVTFRIEVIGTVRQAEIRPAPPAIANVDEARMGTRGVWLPESGGRETCPVYDRERLGPGHRIAGPAIVEQMDATTVVLPGQTAIVDPYFNIVIEGSSQ
jgi:N-methylhydantoinase A